MCDYLDFTDQVFYGMDPSFSIDDHTHSSRSENLLDPSFWFNPYDGYSHTYDTHPSSSGAYNDVTFGGGQLAVSGDANTMSALGPRLRYTLQGETSEIYVTLTKLEECSDHYIAISTSPEPTGFQWSGTSDKVVFAWGCGTKAVYSMSDYSDEYETCTATGEFQVTIRMTGSTATFQDDRCGTLSGQNLHFVPALWHHAWLLRTTLVG